MYCYVLTGLGVLKLSGILTPLLFRIGTCPGGGAKFYGEVSANAKCVYFTSVWCIAFEGGWSNLTY